MKAKDAIVKALGLKRSGASHGHNQRRKRFTSSRKQVDAVQGMTTRVVERNNHEAI